MGLTQCYLPYRILGSFPARGSSIGNAKFCSGRGGRSGIWYTVPKVIAAHVFLIMCTSNNSRGTGKRGQIDVVMLTPLWVVGSLVVIASLRRWYRHSPFECRTHDGFTRMRHSKLDGYSNVYMGAEAYALQDFCARWCGNNSVSLFS